MWILLAALVLVILGGYVSQWYRSCVSETMDSMLAGGSYDPYSPRDSSQPDVVLVPMSSSEEQRKEQTRLLDTGYVSDE